MLVKLNVLTPDFMILSRADFEKLAIFLEMAGLLSSTVSDLTEVFSILPVWVLPVFVLVAFSLFKALSILSFTDEAEPPPKPPPANPPAPPPANPPPNEAPPPANPPPPAEPLLLPGEPLLPPELLFSPAELLLPPELLFPPTELPPPLLELPPPETSGLVEGFLSLLFSPGTAFTVTGISLEASLSPSALYLTLYLPAESPVTSLPSQAIQVCSPSF